MNITETLINRASFKAVLFSLIILPRSWVVFLFLWSYRYQFIAFITISTPFCIYFQSNMDFRRQFKLNDVISDAIYH